MKIYIDAEGCAMGCKLNDRCVMQGTRIKNDEKDSYCDISGKWEAQKEELKECNNSYECATNLCTGNKCYDLSKDIQQTKKDIQETKGQLQKIMDWLKSWFS